MIFLICWLGILFIMVVKDLSKSRHKREVSDTAKEIRKDPPVSYSSIETEAHLMAFHSLESESTEAIDYPEAIPQADVPIGGDVSFDLGFG